MNVAGFKLVDDTKDDVRFVAISGEAGLLGYKITGGATVMSKSRARTQSECLTRGADLVCWLHHSQG